MSTGWPGKEVELLVKRTHDTCAGAQAKVGSKVPYWQDVPFRPPNSQLVRTLITTSLGTPCHPLLQLRQSSQHSRDHSLGVEWRTWRELGERTSYAFALPWSSFQLQQISQSILTTRLSESTGNARSWGICPLHWLPPWRSPVSVRVFQQIFYMRIQRKRDQW